jgi:hypothetical protein
VAWTACTSTCGAANCAFGAKAKKALSFGWGLLPFKNHDQAGLQSFTISRWIFSVAGSYSIE